MALVRVQIKKIGLRVHRGLPTQGISHERHHVEAHGKQQAKIHKAKANEAESVNQNKKSFQGQLKEFLNPLWFAWKNQKETSSPQQRESERRGLYKMYREEN
jgi:hypothetical protein